MLQVMTIIPVRKKSPPAVPPQTAISLYPRDPGSVLWRVCRAQSGHTRQEFVELDSLEVEPLVVGTS